VLILAKTNSYHTN